MGFATTLNVQVEGKTLELTGGDFWAMKEFVADRDRFPGREYEGDRKLWVVPDVSLNEFKSLVEAQSWSLLTNEDEALEAELSAIQSIQNWVRWHSEEISYRSEIAAAKAMEYSYRSKSREKTAAMVASGCFHHALKYAKMPVEELSEPQIATLKSALKRVILPTAKK